MTKTKTKRTKRTKKTDEAVQETPVVPSPSVSSAPPVRRSLLPHNVAYEIDLLKRRVESLETLLASLTKAPTSN